MDKVLFQKCVQRVAYSRRYAIRWSAKHLEED